MTTWRLLDHNAAPGAWNMALDDAILTLYPKTMRPTLRLYRWESPTLSLGYFQPLEDVDLGACRANGIDVVRRPTGGRAVLHHREWTYSVVAGLDAVPGGVAASYRAISEALMSALTQLGLRPQLQRHHARAQSAVCFDTPAFAELTVDNKKVSGSAQTRTKHTLLQHGSIPLTFPFDELSIALGLSTVQTRALKRLAAGVGDFAEVVPEDLHDALVQGFEEKFGPLALDALTSEERDLADTLAGTKYAQLDWRRKEAPYVARR